MSAITTIIFDVGNVLIDFRYWEYMEDLGFEEETIGFLKDNMIFTDFWEAMDRGDEDMDEAREFFCERYPELKNEITLFWNNVAEIVAEYDYAKPLLHALKEKGYRVYLLSNYPKKLAELHWAKFTFLSETDGHIISAVERIAKPDPAIYRLLMDRFRIQAEESIFIDDNQNNVEAAKKLGIDAWLFTGYDELMTRMKERGIL